MNQTALQSITDPKILEILKTVEKFGFKFFGLSETKEVLVTAPNGQVVGLNIAYDFVKTKIIDASKTSNGPEGMPSMPVMPESLGNMPDTNIERSFEIEKQSEKPKEVVTPNSQSDLTVRNIAPKQAVIEPKIDIPFGDGFYPRVFDPTDVNKAQKFIAANANKDDKSSERWLSILWDKFIKELAEK